MTVESTEGWRIELDMDLSPYQARLVAALETFEALVGRTAAGFIEKFDAARERCWIAERDGAIVGVV
jgi:hypothetical protein